MQAGTGFRRVQRDFDHLAEALLALYGRQLLAGDEVVRHGQHCQRPAPMPCGEGVELGRFHFHREDAVAHHLFVQVGSLVVECIRGIDATDMQTRSACICRVMRGAQ